MSDFLVTLVHSLSGGGRSAPPRAADGMPQADPSMPFSAALQALITNGEGSTGQFTLVPATALEGQGFAARGDRLPVHGRDESAPQAVPPLAFNVLHSLLQGPTPTDLWQGMSGAATHELSLSGTTVMATRASPIISSAAMSRLWAAIASRMRFSPEPAATTVAEAASPTLSAALPDAPAPLPEAGAPFQGQQFDSVPPTTGSMAPPPSKVQVPVHAPQWSESFSHRIAWMAKEKVQIAALRLNPPELGAIDVRITLDQADANITFGAQHADVREAIEAALPRLRELLSDHGLNLANVDVSQHSFSDQQAPQGSDEASTADAVSDADALPDSEQAAEAPCLTGTGLIDRYV
jgi:hypothetical protein